MNIKPQQMEIFAASQIAERLGESDRLLEMILERRNMFRALRQVQANKGAPGIDRMVERIWDPTFSEFSYGFRPGKSAHDAVLQSKQYLLDGYTWVVDMDLSKFFDRVNHDRLMSRLATRIADKRVLALIRRYLNAGTMINAGLQPRGFMRRLQALVMPFYS